MRQPWWKWIIACGAIVLSTVPPLGESAIGATTGAPPLPTNYRVLMAQYVRAHDNHVILNAKITKPYERSRSIFLRDPVTAVCVVLFRNNPLGSVVRDNFVMTVDKGEVTEIPISFDQCEGLAPFPEFKLRSSI